MRLKALEDVEQSLALSEVSRFPDFRAGDTVKVVLKVKEQEKTRLQTFEGVCLRRRGEGLSQTFAVRKVSFGRVSAVRNFFLHSPLIDSINLVRRGKVRQSRIYYILSRKGKASRIASL